MAKYMGKRFLFTILTLILVTIFLFVLTHVSGADPAKIMLGTNATPGGVLILLCCLYTPAERA